MNNRPIEMDQNYMELNATTSMYNTLKAFKAFSLKIKHLKILSQISQISVWVLTFYTTAAINAGVQETMT